MARRATPRRRSRWKHVEARQPHALATEARCRQRDRTGALARIDEPVTTLELARRRARELAQRRLRLPPLAASIVERKRPAVVIGPFTEPVLSQGSQVAVRPLALVVAPERERLEGAVDDQPAVGAFDRRIGLEVVVGHRVVSDQSKAITTTSPVSALTRHAARRSTAQ